MKGTYIFLADGFEDIEALGTRDILIRGGVDVKLVGISDEPFVTSSHGLTVGVDEMLDFLDIDENTTEKDFMIFPGGMPGSSNLGGCEALVELMNGHYQAGGSLAAICAAPGRVLSRLEGVGGIEFTGYDGCTGELEAKGCVFRAAPAVKCGRIITGRGPGHTLDFAFEILSAIKGPETMEKIKDGVILACEQ